MNVLIITEEDVLYVYRFFKSFFALPHQSFYSISAITVCAPFNKRSPFALASQAYGFYGMFDFVRMGLLYSMRKMGRRTIKALAQKKGIPVWRTDNVNSSEYIKKIKQHSIDCIVSIAAPQIFNKALIESVPYGCINSHSSLLPENRGMMPVFWGLFKKEYEIGVTIHYINEKIDQGDILLQQRVPVNNESLHEMILKTKCISSHLIDISLRNISAGNVSVRPMPPGGSYQGFPTYRDVKEFKRRGNRIF